MTTQALGPRFSKRRLAELLLALCVVAGFANTTYRFFTEGRLPQPFLFDVYDTLMDWYNTTFWANNPGAYDVWRSVYPPLSFVFLRIFSIHSCYNVDSIHGRDCDPIGSIVMICAYVIVCWMAYRAFRKNDLGSAKIRAIGYSLGFPLLFTLERGNLIMVTLIFFILAYGDLTKSRLVRAMSIGMTINFKPYLVICALSGAFRRHWQLLELAALATLLIYLATYGLVGSGSPMQIASNTAYFVIAGQGQIWEQIYYTTTFRSFLPFNTYLFPTRDFLPDKFLEWFFFLIPIVVFSTVGVSLLSLAGAFVQPKALSQARIAALSLGSYLLWSSPGGYTETFLVFLVFLEKWDGWAIGLALTMAYLISVPYDIILTNIFYTGNHSWLSGKPVTTWFGLHLGVFVRPLMLVLIMWGLAIDSLARIIGAHRFNRPTLTLDRHVAATEQW